MILKLCCLLSAYSIISASAYQCSSIKSYSTYTYNWGYLTTGYRTVYKYCSEGCCSYTASAPCCTYSSSSTLTLIFQIGGSIAGIVVFLIILGVIGAACKKKTRVITTVAPGNTLTVSTTQQQSQIGNQPYPPTLQGYPPSGSQYTGGYPYGNSNMTSNPAYPPPGNLPGQPSYGEAQPLPPKYEPIPDSTSIPH